MEQLLAFAPYVDLTLAAVLFFCAFRFFKQQGSGLFVERTAELEKSLRMLIAEAERAGGAFNDALLSKRTDLEKLLFDLQTAEHRVNKIVEDSEEERKLLRLELERLKTQMSSYSQSVRKEEASYDHTQSRYQAQATRRQSKSIAIGQSAASSDSILELEEEAILHRVEEQHAPQSLLESRIRIPAEQSEKHWSEVESASDTSEYLGSKNLPSTSQKVRPAVFPKIGQSTTSQNTKSDSAMKTEVSLDRKKPMHAALGAKRIHERVEIERTSHQDSEATELSRVVRAAETLLRAGLNIAQVSQQTSLPESEVKTLANSLGLLAQSNQEMQSPIRRRTEQV